MGMEMVIEIEIEVEKKTNEIAKQTYTLMWNTTGRIPKCLRGFTTRTKTKYT